MSIRIKFDNINNNPLPPTLVLCKRNGAKVKTLDAYKVTLSDSFNAPSEISFELHKSVDGNVNPIWDSIKDFKVVWLKELDTYFEIYVDVEESTETIKKCTGKSICEAELSQINVYNLKVNDENSQSDNPVVLYSEQDKEHSLLDMIFSFAPHYEISHVDESLVNVINSYNFDKKAVLDCLDEISKTCNALFVFDSGTDENKRIARTVSVYDLNAVCLDCGYRGDFRTCPDCGSTHVKKGYGQDTTVFFCTDNIADNINLKTDENALFNCFRLDSGDEAINEAIINANLNGTNYLFNLSDDSKQDMSDALIAKLEDYDEEYASYMSEYTCTFNSARVDDYNDLITAYHSKNASLTSMPYSVSGFNALNTKMTEMQDFHDFLKSGMLPSYNAAARTASNQASLISFTNIYLKDFDIDTSTDTINNTIVNYAETFLSSGYKVAIKSSTYNATNGVWSGIFTVSNSQDETDTADTSQKTITVAQSYQHEMEQDIKKILHNNISDDYNVIGLFGYSLSTFTTRIQGYNLDTLIALRDIANSVLDTLVNEGISDKQTWLYLNPNMYSLFYLPYYNKRKALNTEITTRKNEIKKINVLISNAKSIKKTMQAALNFKNYLGTTLWNEFYSFRREGDYNNSCSSSGLTPSQIMAKAKQYIDDANIELVKASVLQHSISCKLKNLLIIPEFIPFLDYFECGNFIRIKADGEIYKLRLLSYQIDYDDLSSIEVTFSDVFKIADNVSDVQSILEQAKSMSHSYKDVQDNADKGAQRAETVNTWFEDGLDLTLVKLINNAVNQEMQFDRHGLLLRKYNDITGTYEDEQLRLINSTIALTTDDWETTKTAIGKFFFVDPVSGDLKQTYGINGETIVGKILIGQELMLVNSANTMRFDSNGLNITNGTNTVIINPNATELFKVTKSTDNLLLLDSNGNLEVKGKITATSGYIGSGTNKITIGTDSTNASIYFGKSTLADTANNGFYIGTDGIALGQGTFKVTSAGALTATNATLKGTITATSFTAWGSSEYTKTVINDAITLYNADGSQEAAYIGIRNSVTNENGSMKLCYNGLAFYNGSYYNGSHVCAIDYNPDGILGFSGKMQFNDRVDFVSSIYCDGNIMLTDTGKIYAQIGEGMNAQLVMVNNGYAYYGAQSEEVSGLSGTYIRGQEVILYSNTNGAIYLRTSGGTAVTSDETLKDISPIDKKYVKFFNALNPVAYKYKIGHRQHIGFGAQSVEKALSKAGLTNEDFAGLIIQKDVNLGEDENISPDGNKHFDELYSLRYEEFIALNTMMIKNLQAKIKALETQIKSLRGN